MPEICCQPELYATDQHTHPSPCLIFSAIRAFASSFCSHFFSSRQCLFSSSSVHTSIPAFLHLQILRQAVPPPCFKVSVVFLTSSNSLLSVAVSSPKALAPFMLPKMLSSSFLF